MDEKNVIHYCFVCGYPLDENGHCTNPDCPMSMIPEAVAVEEKNDEEK